MRIGILSDLHGNIEALDAFSADLKKRDLHKVIYLGDFCGYYPHVAECIDYAIEHAWVAIAGNHDDAFIKAANPSQHPNYQEDYVARYGSSIEAAMSHLKTRHWEYLRNLPDFLELDIFGRRALAIHGTPWDHRNGRVYPDFKQWDRYDDFDYEVFLQGHTHYAFFKKVGGKDSKEKIFINPGSLGQPRDIGRWASYIILDSDRFSVETIRFELEIQKIIASLNSINDHHEYSRRILER